MGEQIEEKNNDEEAILFETMLNIFLDILQFRKPIIDSSFCFSYRGRKKPVPVNSPTEAWTIIYFAKQ